MKNSKLLAQGALSSFGVLVYIAAVAWVMWNGDNLFGQMDNFWGPMMFLMLFVLSAAIVGLLIFGRPLYMFLNGHKKEAVSLVFYTILWLFILTVFGFVIFSAI